MTSEKTDDMSDNELDEYKDRAMPIVVYVLYLAGFCFPVIANIGGVAVAYVYHDDAPDWVKTHYRYQIRTFWIGVAMCFVTILAMFPFVFPGILMGLLASAWLIVRCVLGLKWYSERVAVPDPDTLTW